jgi:hypothetical protein
LADAYFALGIIEKSILNYKKSISINPSFDEAYHNLAVSLFTQQNYA